MPDRIEERIALIEKAIKEIGLPASTDDVIQLERLWEELLVVQAEWIKNAGESDESSES